MIFGNFSFFLLVLWRLGQQLKGGKMIRCFTNFLFLVLVFFLQANSYAVVPAVNHFVWQAGNVSFAGSGDWSAFSIVKANECASKVNYAACGLTDLGACGGDSASWVVAEPPLGNRSWDLCNSGDYLGAGSLLMRVSQTVICADGSAPNPDNTCGITCTVGQPSYLGMQSTIASFDEFNRVVPADAMRNPQCVGGCESYLPGGGTLVCAGTFDQNDPRAVGTTIFVKCTQNITLTGVTCNIPGSPTWTVAVDAPSTGQVPMDGVASTPGTGGGLSWTITDAANLEAIKTNTTGVVSGVTGTNTRVDQTNSLLDGIKGNQVTGDANAESRHVESRVLLDAIKGLLETIGTTTAGGSLGTTDGTSTGPGLDPVPDRDPVNLMAPGEEDTNIIALQNLTLDRPSGDCPTWTFNVFSNDYVLNSHCSIIASSRGILETVMSVVWVVLGLLIVLSA